MKNIVVSIKIGLLTGCMALSSSCSDFLDKQPPASTAGVALESEQGVEAILVGAYADLDGIDRFGGALGADSVSYTHLVVRAFSQTFVPSANVILMRCPAGTVIVCNAIGVCSVCICR